MTFSLIILGVVAVILGGVVIALYNANRSLKKDLSAAEENLRFYLRHTPNAPAE